MVIKMKSTAIHLAVILSFLLTGPASLLPWSRTSVGAGQPTGLAVLGIFDGHRAELSLEQRLRYLQRVEEVYYRHRLWSGQGSDLKPRLEEAMPLAVIRAKVEDTFRKTEELERYWNHAITGEQLQAEIDRMATQTKNPALLRELWHALDDDPRVIAECLARPILVDRLLRDWYARDARFHGALRATAEAGLQRALSPDRGGDTGGALSKVEWVKGEDSGPTEESFQQSEDPGVREVSAAE